MNSRELLASPRASLAGTLLAPALLLLLVRTLVGGPGSAPASVSLTPGPGSLLAPAPLLRPVLSPAQQRAQAWMRERTLYRSGPDSSPMESPVPPASTAAVAPPAATEPSVPTPTLPAHDPLDSITISAIMGTGSSGFVSVGGTVLRLGDVIAPGWRITGIDGRNRLITVSDVGNQLRTLRMGQ